VLPNLSSICLREDVRSSAQAVVSSC
jgi:hypothetical protein